MTARRRRHRSAGPRRCLALCASVLFVVAGRSAHAQTTLEFATFHGASADLAVDDSGDVWVYGGTELQPIEEPLVVAPGAPCDPGPSPDVQYRWLAKIDGDTGEIEWTRSMPGARVFAVAVDPTGTHVYACGWGGSVVASEFPPTGWKPTPSPGRDGYVARFDARTGCPQAISYFGLHDGGNVYPHSVFVDANGDVHVVGGIGVTGLQPTQILESYVPAGGSLEAFAVGFDATLAQRNYFAFLPGGSASDDAQDVVADASGVYVAGASGESTLTYTPQRVGIGGARDAWVMKFVPDGSGTSANPVHTSLEYGTYIGGSDDEATRGNSGIDAQQQGAWLDVDEDGEVTVATWTTSTDLPVTATYGPRGDDDVVVTHLDAGGANPTYLTIVGGRRDDIPAGIARDRARGRVYVAGGTKSNDFPTPLGLVTSHASAPSKPDGFLIEIDDDTGALVSGTFLGGPGVDDGDAGVEVDAQGFVHVGGKRGDAAFAPQRTTATYSLDHYLCKFSFGPPAPQPGVSVSPTVGLETSEAGAIDSFTIVLDTQPAAAVSIDVTSDDTSEVLVSYAGSAPAATVTVSIDPSDWSLPRTVTLVGQDDADLDGDVDLVVRTAAAVSADVDYAGVDADDVLVTNVDDDAPPPLDVADVSPALLAAGSSEVVTITGQGFDGAPSLSFEDGSGGPAPSAEILGSSATEITARVSVGNQGPKGDRTWKVRVTNSSGATGVWSGNFVVRK